MLYFAAAANAPAAAAGGPPAVPEDAPAAVAGGPPAVNVAPAPVGAPGAGAPPPPAVHPTQPKKRTSRSLGVAPKAARLPVKRRKKDLPAEPAADDQPVADLPAGEDHAEDLPIAAPNKEKPR